MGSDHDSTDRGAEQPHTTVTASRPLDEPHPSRLDPAHPLRREILAAHAEALAADAPGYIDPASGLFVLTAATLAARGECCENGCRHCPFLA